MRPDVSKENHVIQLSPAGASVPPGVVPADADIQQSTHPLDRQVRLLRINEPEPLRLVSLAKKAVAFFNRSRS